MVASPTNIIQRPNAENVRVVYITAHNVPEDLMYTLGSSWFLAAYSASMAYPAGLVLTGMVFAETPAGPVSLQAANEIVEKAEGIPPGDVLVAVASNQEVPSMAQAFVNHEIASQVCVDPSVIFGGAFEASTVLIITNLSALALLVLQDHRKAGQSLPPTVEKSYSDAAETLAQAGVEDARGPYPADFVFEFDSKNGPLTISADGLYTMFDNWGDNLSGIKESVAKAIAAGIQKTSRRTIQGQGTAYDVTADPSMNSLREALNTSTALRSTRLKSILNKLTAFYNAGADQVSSVAPRKATDNAPKTKEIPGNLVRKKGVSSKSVVARAVSKPGDAGSASTSALETKEIVW
jgi:hypothetical protein